MLVVTPACTGLTNRWSPRRFGVTCQAPLSPTATFSICSSGRELERHLIAGRGLELDDLVGIIVDASGCAGRPGRASGGPAPTPARRGSARARASKSLTARPPGLAAGRAAAGRRLRRCAGLRGAGTTTTGLMPAPARRAAAAPARAAAPRRCAVAQHLEAERIDEPVLDRASARPNSGSGSRRPRPAAAAPGRRRRAAGSRSAPSRCWRPSAKRSSRASRPRSVRG